RSVPWARRAARAEATPRRRAASTRKRVVDEVSSCAAVFAVCSGEADEQHQRRQGKQQPRNFGIAELLAENGDADGGEQHDHRDGVEDADGAELQVLHHEEPTEGRRGVDREADVEGGTPERRIPCARELQEVIAEHAHRAERDRHQHRECLAVHGGATVARAIALARDGWRFRAECAQSLEPWANPPRIGLTTTIHATSSSAATRPASRRRSASGRTASRPTSRSPREAPTRGRTPTTSCWRASARARR